MRNAEATRERILEAALEEFSSYGVAGARVDRIAKNAGCNKNMIYVYFENKETLFKTVLQKHLARVYEENEFTPDDLPGYAARVFEYAMSHADLFRLMAWYGLEKNVIGDLADRSSVQEKKLQMIADAQDAGQVGQTFAPGFLMTAIMALATAWTATNPFGPSYDRNAADRLDETKEAVAAAIRLLVKGEEGSAKPTR